MHCTFPSINQLYQFSSINSIVEWCPLTSRQFFEISESIVTVQVLVPKVREIELLADVYTTGKDDDKQRVFVLHGLGGSGKSQLAYKFVEESQAKKLYVPCALFSSRPD